MADTLDYGPVGLDVQPPAGFFDSQSISSALFDKTRDESGLDGVLLKIYLPDDIWQFYAEGRDDAVIRQLCLYGFRNSDKLNLDRKAFDLMVKSLEGAYIDYRVLSPEIRRNRQALLDTMLEAMRTGAPLLINTFHADTTSGYVSLQPLDMGEEKITLAFATSLTLVADTVVIATASSIIRNNDPLEQTAWARSAVESAADMLVTQNKSDK